MVRARPHRVTGEEPTFFFRQFSHALQIRVPLLGVGSTEADMLTWSVVVTLTGGDPIRLPHSAGPTNGQRVETEPRRT